LIGVLAAATVVVAQPQSTTRTFEAEKVNTPPDGLTLASTRQPTPGVWVVRRDASGQHLVHEADVPAQPGFSLAIAASPSYRDVNVSARLKLTGGDRSAGVVWRYQDAQNYYVATLDLARHELALFRVVQGNRVRLDREDDLELDAAAWHTLKVRHDGSEIRVYLGGIRVFEQDDRTFRSGGTGLWASSGTTVAFDDVRVEPEKERTR